MIAFAGENEMEPDQFVREMDGTFNPETKRFLCDECYIRAGQPTNEDRTPWRCP